MNYALWIAQGLLALLFLWAGGIKLVLPLEKLTGPMPLAAAGLVIIMIGATVFTLATGDIAMALIPLVVGLLSAFVAYGRWRLAPLSTRS
ncbi:MAG: DoxX family protein [Deltaproteobacteria bacterium]|nr:DoxX family protein [Deltaproteobacteria bacterium]MBI2349261.1 DoxX family protein [Deltaproteobacteria bacterium]MBI2540441.1 DoxX family protein [Deltaproteobacteria bacterium]MBI2992287.1 DoxX family protein [Deltaproteobacteria bacterium]MBI3061715.1 DoxX family protein [Deltaproteobacteria bacterium]